MNQGVSEQELQWIAQLTYLDIEGKNLSGENSYLSDYYINKGKKITIGDLIDYYSGTGKFNYTKEGVQKIETRFSGETLGRNEYELYQELFEKLNTPEYRDWVISDVVSNNEKHESGFVAFTVTPAGTNDKIIAFRGSEPIDDSEYRNDWKNNFQTLYKMESPQQKDVEAYMNYIQEKLTAADELYLTGHSLGGNLALFATFILPKALRDKLVTVTTFNAPGFNRHVLKQYENIIKALKDGGKITEFRNYYDYLVPSLLINPTDGVYIDSVDGDAGMMANHSMFLLAYDELGNLLRNDKQTPHVMSQTIHRLTLGFEALPKFIQAGLVEGIFKVWNGKIDLYDFIFGAAVAALLVTVGPIAVLKGIVIAVVSLYVIGFIRDVVFPAIQKGIANLTNLINTLVQQGIAFVTNLINEIIRTAKLVGQKIAAFQQGLKVWVSNLFNKVKTGLKKLVQHVTNQVKKAANAVKQTVKKVKDTIAKGAKKFVSQLKALGKKVVSKVKATLRKQFITSFLVAVSIASGPKIAVRLAQLESMYQGMRRKQERIHADTERILAITSRMLSNVSSQYRESYVQSRIRQIQALQDRVRSSHRKSGEQVRQLMDGLKYALSKYRDVEANIRRSRGSLLIR